jgi:hypothetical protein
MTFWCGSGSESADPDTPIFVIDLQEAKNKFIFEVFLRYTF